MDIDQNINRADLLPATIPLAVLAVLAVLGIAAWILLHRWLHRRRETIRARVRLAILLPVGTAACWCLYQLAGRLLFLAGPWPLWLAALATAASVEGVSLFYERECAAVDPRIARRLVLMRMLAVATTLFILMQPVLVRTRTRHIRRRVAVLLDESSSMTRKETQWTLGERLDMAQAMGLVKPAERPIAAIAENAEDFREKFRAWRQLLSAAQFAGADADGSARSAAVDIAALATDAKAALSWAEAACEPAAKLAEAVKDSRYESGRDAANALLKGLRDIHAAARRLASPDTADLGPADYPPLCSAIADGLDRVLTNHARATDVASSVFWDSLSAPRRTSISTNVEIRRTRLAQALLAGSKALGVPSLYDSLASRYDIDLFRFGGDLQPVPDTAGHFAWLATNTVDALAFAAGQDDETAPSAALPAPARSRADSAEIAFQSSTDVTRALEEVVESIPSEELAGVLLFTDGRHTGDAGVEAVSRRLGQAGVHVSSVVIGGSRPLLDVAIADVRTAEAVFLGDRVRVTADLAVTGAKGSTVAVRLVCGEETVDEKTFPISSDDWATEARFTDLPEDKGVRRYRIEADVLPGETVVANNRWTVDVSVSDDRTNVLLVDQRPRWEYRYLRNLFYGRDKSVHLQYWLVSPDSISGETQDLPPASASREFGEAEAGGLPVSRDEWRKFDVVIFGDVGDDVLTPEAVADLRHCVEERGALAVFIAGPESMPYGIHDASLLDLLPVIPGERPSGDLRHGPEDAFRFTLTPAGSAHPITPLSSSVSENAQIWREQPDWHWRVPIEDIRPGAEVLAYAAPSASAALAPTPPAFSATPGDSADSAEDAIARLAAIRQQQTRNALLVVRGQGRGHVAMLLTDHTWRLRYRVGDTYHHRFWGQIVRWGVGDKLRAGNNYARLGTDQLRYTPREPVKILARLADRDFTPIQDASVNAVVSLGERRIARVSLQHRPDSNGMYEATLDPLPEPGLYTVTLESKTAENRLGPDFPKNLSTRFSVVTARRPAEFVHATADWTVPRTMARLTGGQALPPSRATTLWDQFGEGSGIVMDRIETNLWDSPWLFLAVVFFLTAEWLLRKRGGLA